MNYSWQIRKLSTRDQTNADGVVLSDAVVKIKWKRTGVDGEGNSATILGYTVLSAENVAVDNFVNFNSLTEETVVGWLESTISTGLMASYNDKILEKINGPSTTERAVPWS